MSSQMDNWVSNPNESNGPMMAISIWSLCAASGLFLALRIHIRFGLGKLWLDDILLIIGWAFLLVQAILNQLSVNLGFGKHALDIDLGHLETITYYGASGLTISVIAITLSKISFGVTLLRLTETWAMWYTWFAIVTSAVVAIPIAILPWVQCKPLVKTFIDFYPGECIDKHPSVKFGEFQATWSALMDISLALVPWTILWNVKMRLSEKIGVGIAMSLGVLVGATAIMRAIYVQQLTKQDISYDATKSVIWSAAESAVAIIATSIPVLRTFLKKKVESTLEYIQNSSGRSRVNSALQSKGMNGTSNGGTTKSSAFFRKKSWTGSKSGTLMGDSKNWINLDNISDTAESEKSDKQRRMDGPEDNKQRTPHFTLQ